MYVVVAFIRAGKLLLTGEFRDDFIQTLLDLSHPVSHHPAGESRIILSEDPDRLSEDVRSRVELEHSLIFAAQKEQPVEACSTGVNIRG